MYVEQTSTFASDLPASVGKYRVASRIKFIGLAGDAIAAVDLVPEMVTRELDVSMQSPRLHHGALGRFANGESSRCQL